MTIFVKIVENWTASDLLLQMFIMGGAVETINTLYVGC
jgi:hypothetical protein